MILKRFRVCCNFFIKIQVLDFSSGEDFAAFLSKELALGCDSPGLFLHLKTRRKNSAPPK